MNAYTITKDIRSWVSILLLAAVFALGVVGFASHSAHAQAPSGELQLTGSGLPINLVAVPGTSVTTDISVRNTGLQAETLKTSLLKFGANNAGGATISERAPGDDYFNWVTISPSSFTVQPNESKSVRMTINLPKEAAFGYYYAVAFSRASDPAPSKGQTVKGSLATLVLLEAQVPGAKRELQVTDFSSTLGVYEFLPSTFNVKIKNTGNVHAVPHGDVTISQGNSELARMAINAAGKYILPGSTRTFTVQWNDGFPRTVEKTADGKVTLDDKGKPESQFEVNWGSLTKFRIGQYTAHLLMVFDDGKRDVPIERSTDFLILPWKLLIVIIVIVGLIIWAIVNDIIKIEHFLFRKKGSGSASTKSASARSSVPKFKAPASLRKASVPAKKPATKKPVTRKKATTTRKKK